MAGMRPMCGGRVAACVALVGLGLGACSDGDADVASSGGCDGGAPVLAFDHETTDPDRGIGGGVPEVSVVSAGGEIEMITGSWVASQATFSPDGDQLVVVKAEGDYESAGPSSTGLWVMGTDGSEPRELTGGDVLDEDPDWSPDGSSIAFSRGVYEGGRFVSSIVTVPADPSGEGEPTELLTVGGDQLDRPVWSPDGQRIAFVRSVYRGTSGDTETTVWTMAADGTGARPLVELPGAATLDWHPDGSSLLVDADGQEQETYLVDASSGRARLLGTGADLARWSPDGRSVFYFEFGGRGTPAEGEIWSLVEGRIEDGALVEDRTVLDAAAVEDTVLADVGLDPGFSLAVGPCAGR
jgi:Tol biopolymer transport system component